MRNAFNSGYEPAREEVARKASPAIEIASSLLFLYTVDDLHGLFVGAMCATGSLNASPVGWWVLPVKVLIVIAAPLWIVLNGLDVRAGDFPVIRAKYGARHSLVNTG